MSKETKETQCLCDLVKSRYQDRLDNIFRDNAFRDFGQLINNFYDEDNFSLFDPNRFLYLVSQARNALLNDLESRPKFYKKSEHKVWENGKLIVDETKEESSDDYDDNDVEVYHLDDEEDNELYITEADLLYAFYLRLTSDIYKDSPKMTQEEFFDIFEDKVTKEELEKFFIKDTATYDESLKIVEAMQEINPINYRALNKSLFGDKFIFIPIKDFFTFNGEI